MSRIGRAPITVPSGVTVTLTGNRVHVKGPKGELERSLPAEMVVKQENGTITVSRPSDEPNHRALHGLTRALVNNMVEGVTKGFQKTLEIVGVGYKAETRPYGLQLALGFSHPVEYRAPEGIKLTATNPTTVVIDGADKEGVGQGAAASRRPRGPRAAGGIRLTATTPTTVVIDGADKEVVGQVAAEIRSLRPPEPYKGKGVKYQGEVIRRKAGKARGGEPRGGGR